MIDQNLKNMEQQAVDLSDVSEKEALAKREAERRAEANALAAVLRWERRMQRAFKGIVPRPVRRAQLDRAAAAQEAADAA